MTSVSSLDEARAYVGEYAPGMDVILQQKLLPDAWTEMTVDLFDMDPSAFIDGIEYAGAARFFEFAGESDICLYI